MRITEALFAGSSTRISEKPKQKFPEFAFIGRSNVGKSSLINMLCNNRKLALTSSSPGKTRLVNHFLVNREWYLVDLPGYGYAKMSMSGRQKLAQIIRNYINLSPELVMLFVLIETYMPELIDLVKADGLHPHLALDQPDILRRSGQSSKYYADRGAYGICGRRKRIRDPDGRCGCGPGCGSGSKTGQRSVRGEHGDSKAVAAGLQVSAVGNRDTLQRQQWAVRTGGERRKVCFRN